MIVSCTGLCIAAGAISCLGNVHLLWGLWLGREATAQASGCWGLTLGLQEPVELCPPNGGATCDEVMAGGEGLFYFVWCATWIVVAVDLHVNIPLFGLRSLTWLGLWQPLAETLYEKTLNQMSAIALLFGPGQILVGVTCTGCCCCCCFCMSLVLYNDLPFQPPNQHSLCDWTQSAPSG